MGLPGRDRKIHVMNLTSGRKQVVPGKTGKGKSLLFLSILAACAMNYPCWAMDGTEGESLLEEYRPILEVSSFADSSSPDSLLADWTVASGDTASGQQQPAPASAWSLGTDGASGSGSLCIAAAAPVAVVSPPILLDPGLQSVSGGVTASGPGDARAQVLWMAGDRIIETVTLREAPPSPTGPRRFNLSESMRPAGASAARIVLVRLAEGAEPFCWQTARLSGLFTYTPEVSLLYNRLGYEQVAPKHFTVYANFPATSGRFYLENAVGDRVYQGILGDGKHIQGADGAHWEGYYFQGDFTDYEEEGDHTLTVLVEDYPPLSAPVTIRFNLFWEEAFLPVVLPFRNHRAEDMTEDGFIRLWNDPGVNAGSDAALLWSLVQSWSILRGRFAQEPPLLALEEEAFHGAGRIADWILQGNAARVIAHEDYGLYLNALSCIVRYRKEAGNIMKAAQLLLTPSREQKRPGAWCFCAALDLYAATGEKVWLEYAKEIYPGITLERVESLLDFEGLTDAPVTQHLKETFAKLADPLLTAADNPFGLVRSGELGGRGFFTWSAGAGRPLLGNNARLFAAMHTVAQAYRYSAQKEYLVFVYDQLNWLFGNNPFGACLVTGICSSDEPAPIPADTREAGLVLHGIGPHDAGSDTPRFYADSRERLNEDTQGSSLQNNAQYLRALAFLKRIPVSRPK